MRNEIKLTVVLIIMVLDDDVYLYKLQMRVLKNLFHMDQPKRHK
jgi:ATP-dependent Clp protease adapter protein ClpS